jgi:hypothetical protein
LQVERCWRFLGVTMQHLEEQSPIVADYCTEIPEYEQW